MNFNHFKEDAEASAERINQARARAKEKSAKRLARADPKGAAVRQRHKDILNR